MSSRTADRLLNDFQSFLPENATSYVIISILVTDPRYFLHIKQV